MIRVVLDSNEYISYLNGKNSSLAQVFGNYNAMIHINEIIVKEVLKNVRETAKGEFYRILFKENISVHNEKIPNSLLRKYSRAGLKKGDILIAAFCEHVSADYLVTENRHFLKSERFDKFQIVNMDQFNNC